MVDNDSAQDLSGCVLAAIDVGPSSRRVLLHAAGFARLFSTRLKALHVSTDASAEQRQHVREHCALQGPMRSILPTRTLSCGRALCPRRSIVRRLRRRRASLSWVPGVTESWPLSCWGPQPKPSSAMRRHQFCSCLRSTSISSTWRIACGSGPVLAAVDLADANDQQLRFGGELAQLAGQPLLLLTVTGRRLTERLSSSMLRKRAQRAAVMPRAVIVRHGDVAKEISRCAVAERTGLVVMGLRSKLRGRPGAIASAVLSANSAFVLAVPEVSS